MTYDEFYQKVKEHFTITWHDKRTKEKTGFYWKDDASEDGFQIKWITGGASGGNCWGDEPHFFVGSESPDYSILDNFLLKICPNISLSLYREILEKFPAKDDRDYEYYGNFTDYKTHNIQYRELYNVLKEHYKW